MATADGVPFRCACLPEALAQHRETCRYRLPCTATTYSSVAGRRARARAGQRFGLVLSGAGFADYVRACAPRPCKLQLHAPITSCSVRSLLCLSHHQRSSATLSLSIAPCLFPALPVSPVLPRLPTLRLPRQLFRPPSSWHPAPLGATRRCFIHAGRFKCHCCSSTPCHATISLSMYDTHCTVPLPCTYCLPSCMSHCL
jgi:hypothetical protein